MACRARGLVASHEPVLWSKTKEADKNDHLIGWRTVNNYVKELMSAAKDVASPLWEHWQPLFIEGVAGAGSCSRLDRAIRVAKHWATRLCTFVSPRSNDDWFQDGHEILEDEH